MFKHIMIPVDGSELADKAVGEGLKLAKAFGAKVTALIAEHEYELPTYGQIASHSAVSVPEHERRIKEHAAKILEAVSARAKELGVRFEGRLMEDDEPYAAIVKAGFSRSMRAMMPVRKSTPRAIILRIGAQP